MQDMKILIASHKAYWIPNSDLYLPIKVGADLNDSDMPGFTPDNIGENISSKNPSYCELTALYWAWKNLRCDYVGLVHYRRYFKGTGEKNTLQFLDMPMSLYCNQVIVPSRRNYYIESVYSHYVHAHHSEPLDMALHIVNKTGDKYIVASDLVMRRRWLYLFNMFIMNRPLFVSYCEWLFPILSKVEENVDISNYDIYESRVYGFLAERLFNIWIVANNIKTIEMPYVALERQRFVNKSLRFLMRKIKPRY